MIRTTRFLVGGAFAAALLCQAHQTAAESQVHYSLDLSPAGSPGNPADGQVFSSGVLLKWEMALEAFGVQAFGVGAGHEIQGVANFVFDLELRAGSCDGPLVPTAQFIGDPNDPNGPPAVFSRSCRIISTKTGRVIDPLIAGGPNMARDQYPTDLGDGALYGMGAGYLGWNRSSIDQFTTPGVGQEYGPCEFRLAEGYIEVEPGMYCLTCIPGTGTNVLRGDIDLTRDQGSFAMAAEITFGDSIAFEVRGDDGPQLIAAVSRRLHGHSRTFDLYIPLDGSVLIEPRKNGSQPQMVLIYDDVPDDPGCDGLTVINGTCESTAVLGHDLVIDMTYDLYSCVEVTVGSDTLRVLTHTGNVNDDDPINVLDLQYCKNRVFEDLDESNFVCDINVDGLMNVMDLQDMKRGLFTNLTCE